MSARLVTIRRRLDSALRTPWLSRRGARALILFALLLKLLASAWNASAFDGLPYDNGHHRDRASHGGLEVDDLAYDPPLYYIPALVHVEDRKVGRLKPGATSDDLLQTLRYTNVVYLALFYCCWLYVIFPRLIRNWRATTIASVILLALPGYQKLGCVSHADNLLVSLSAVALAFFVWLRDRQRPLADWFLVVGYSLMVGLVGWTRPFAAVPVFVLWLGGMALLVRDHRGRWLALASRAAVITVLVGAIASGWYVKRYHKLGHISPGYSDWVEPYVRYRPKLGKWHFFTSVYPKKLLELPNMLHCYPKQKYARTKLKPSVKKDITNSFPTIAYSELWGDHWVRFSSSKYRTEEKLWPKRMLLVAALPLVLLLAARFFRAVGRTLLMAVRKTPGAGVRGLLLLYVVLAAALYFYWLTHSALTPGLNSAIKFTYNAHVFPVGLAIAWLDGVGPRRYNLWLGYVLMVFMLALPIAVFWPSP